jgi:hypothetical protein
MRLLIVGSGYTGRHLYASAKDCGFQVSATSRHPDRNLSYIDQDDRIFFDLENPSTWAALPPIAPSSGVSRPDPWHSFENSPKHEAEHFRA